MIIGISDFLACPLKAGWISPSLTTRLAAPSLMIGPVFLIDIAVGGGGGACPAVGVVPLVLVAAIVVVAEVGVGVGVVEEARKSFLSKSSCWSVYCA